MNGLKNRNTPRSKDNSENKIDISEAEVVPNKDDVAEKLEEQEAQKKYVENLNDQKTIDLSEVGKKDVGEKTTIDFMNEESIENFTSANTKKAEPNIEDKKKSHFEGKSIEDVKEQITKEENDSAKKFTLKDMEEIAGFIIELIDTGFSSAFNWWAGDTAVSAYSLQKSKKDMLSYQLALILVKYQAKFKIEFMFLLSIIIMYAPAFMAAKRRKNEIKQGYVNTQKKNSTTYKEQINNSQSSEKKDDTIIADNIKDGVANLGALKPRRNKGKQGKV